MKGNYLLIMTLPKDTSVMVGKQGMLHFTKGCYAYVGSALNGLEQRIQRHLRTDKKTHWHIDYLLPFTEIIEILYKENSEVFRVLGAVIVPVKVICSMGPLKK
jgi:Uri superfamily endonuclease